MPSDNSLPYTLGGEAVDFISGWLQHWRIQTPSDGPLDHAETSLPDTD